MNTLNPSKYIRAAYISALESATGVKVWHRMVPKNVVVPASYIILDSQTKNETVNAKPSEVGGGNTYFEWLTTIDVNIYRINEKGYSSASVVDDLEQIVINVIRSGVVIPNFRNKDTRILESISLDAETSTQSIDRRVVKFEHWLDRSEV